MKRLIKSNELLTIIKLPAIIWLIRIITFFFLLQTTTPRPQVDSQGKGVAKQGLWIPNPACLAGHVPGSPAHSPAQDQGGVIRAVPGCCRRDSPESPGSSSSLCRSEAGSFSRKDGERVKQWARGLFLPQVLSSWGSP